MWWCKPQLLESVCRLPIRSRRLRKHSLTQWKASHMLTRQNCSLRLEAQNTSGTLAACPSFVTSLLKWYITHLNLKMLWRKRIVQWGSENLYSASGWDSWAGDSWTGQPVFYTSVTSLSTWDSGRHSAFLVGITKHLCIKMSLVLPVCLAVCKEWRSRGNA